VVLTSLAAFGAQHATQCDSLTTRLREQLAARAGQLAQLADAVVQLVAAQSTSLTSLSDITTTQHSADLAWLTGYNDLVRTATGEQLQLSRQLNEGQLAPLLSALTQNLDDQAQQLAALQAALRTDIDALLASFSAFASDLAARMTDVRGAVDSYAAEAAKAMGELARENAAIQASEAGFKRVLDDMMARYLAHAGQVTASTAAMATATANCGRLAGQLVSKVQAVETSVTAARQEMAATTEQQAEEAAGRWTDAVRQCEATIESVRSSSTRVGNVVQEYVDQSQETMLGLEREAKDKIEKATAAKSACVTQFEERTAEAATRLEADAAAMTEGIQKNVQSDKQVISNRYRYRYRYRDSFCCIIWHRNEQK
jgi:hypothetical protein